MMVFNSFVEGIRWCRLNATGECLFLCHGSWGGWTRDFKYVPGS